MQCHFRVLKTFVYSVLLVKLYTVSNNEDLTQYKHIIKHFHIFGFSSEL